MIVRSIYVKYEPKTGAPYIREHRVWDADLFFSALDRTSKAEGSRVVITTEANYKEWRKHGKQQ